MSELWEPRPLPEITPENERYWRAASESRLLLSHCPECEFDFVYPRARCPDCFASTGWIEASGDGVVYSYSVAEAVDGWPEHGLPLIVAYVELAEGPRVMTNIVDCDPRAVSVGDPVSATFIQTDTADLAIPVFRLD